MFFIKKFKKSKRAFSLIELSLVILIIGIIVGGVTQSSRLIGAFKLSSARSLSKSSPVASIEGLAAWWDATADGSFPLNQDDDGVAITNWYDMNPQTVSANRNNVAQANSTKQPSYKASAINGLPAVRFTASQYLEMPYVRDVNSDQFTLFAVVSTSGYGLYGPIISSRDFTTSGGYVLYAADTGDYEFWIGDGGFWSGAYVYSSPIILNKAIVLTAGYNGTARNLYQNGSLILTGSTSFVANAQKELAIGGVDVDGGSPLYLYNGYIGEIILFNRNLKISDRTAVEEYLRKKWSVSLL